ncbi:hypothetical protein HC256_010406 [Beauveria bassiana]|nr:hypothetical protein HC256_010406 [Beauveria bassiana]
MVGELLAFVFLLDNGHNPLAHGQGERRPHPSAPIDEVDVENALFFTDTVDPRVQAICEAPFPVRVVHRRPCREERCHARLVSDHDRPLQRRAAVSGLSSDVSSPPQKQPHGILVLAQCRPVQRGDAGGVARVDPGAFGEEVAGNVRVAALRGKRQRVAPPVVPDTGVGTSVEQRCHKSPVAVQGGVEKRRPAKVVLSVDGHPAPGRQRLQKQFCQPVLGGKMTDVDILGRTAEPEGTLFYSLHDPTNVLKFP